MNLPWLTSGERSIWLMKKSIRAFDKINFGQNMSKSFLTITQSNENMGHSWISNIMEAAQKEFKRRGQRMEYVAVLEIQPKRYEKFGVIAPHWHVTIKTSVKDAFPHAKRLENGRIKKIRNGEIITWNWLFRNVKQKFGMYFCCDCWGRNVYDYLMKYLAKGRLLDEYKRLARRKIRVFSSSRISIENYMSWCQKMEYMNLVKDESDYAQFYMRRVGSKINMCAREVVENVEFDGVSSMKMYYRVIHALNGEWMAVVNDLSPGE